MPLGSNRYTTISIRTSKIHFKGYVSLVYVYEILQQFLFVIAGRAQLKSKRLAAVAPYLFSLMENS